jgi:NADPH:quinone reductase-like Zn-dependent oxidoreductase
MNFKDVVITIEQVASPYLSIKYSSIVTYISYKVSLLKVSNYIYAISQGAYSTYTYYTTTSTTIIPKDISFKIATSILVIYSTAYYSIIELANIQLSKIILIYTMSSNISQAAIQLSKILSTEIYTTIGSAEKKQLLINTYNISKTYIFYNQDITFSPTIREATRERGVNIILNSLTRDLIQES